MKLCLAIALVLALTATSRAAIKTEAVAYEHNGTKLEGYLAYDDSAPGKRPGVLIVHEWLGVGPNVKKRAEMLAGLGYVGFALDMYGKGVEGKSPQDGMRLSGPFKKDRKLMRARAGAAYEVLKKHPKVDPTKLGAIGYCFGGATALELARGGYELDGVVSFHGALETPMPAKAGQVKAKVLACHGAADPFVPPPEVAAFEKEMTDAGVDWQLNAYGGAVHSFTNPQANNKSGGTAYDPAADRRSWEAMKAFFAEVFK